MCNQAEGAKCFHDWLRVLVSGTDTIYHMQPGMSATPLLICASGPPVMTEVCSALLLVHRGDTFLKYKYMLACTAHKPHAMHPIADQQLSTATHCMLAA